VDPAVIEQADALAPFRTALAKRDRLVRVSWFGESLTADDHMTHALRTQLADGHGNGGPGFVFATPPHPSCQHRACRRTDSGEWAIHGIAGLVPPDKLLGRERRRALSRRAARDDASSVSASASATRSSTYGKKNGRRRPTASASWSTRTSS
jgi:hypothetical protein